MGQLHDARKIPFLLVKSSPFFGKNINPNEKKVLNGFDLFGKAFKKKDLRSKELKIIKKHTGKEKQLQK